MKTVVTLRKSIKHFLPAQSRPAIWAATRNVIEVLESRIFLSAVNAGFTPDQIRTAYGLGAVATPAVSFGNVTGDGSGQTIALIEAYNDPNLASDLATFDTQFGIPAPSSLTLLNEQGTAGSLPGAPPVGDTTSALEEIADVEWAHATAPGANIDVIECASQNAADFDAGAAAAAALSGVSVVSESVSTPESTANLVTNPGDYVTPAKHQGVTFLAASGDDGGSPGYPADLATVVGVGGTVLTTTDSSGDYGSETAWADSQGGPSSLVSKPSFQNDIAVGPLSNSAVSPTSRLVPDVSAEAGGAGYQIYDSYNSGGWQADTGTSLSTPFWAGLVAIADQGRTVNSLGTLDGASQTLPLLYSAPASIFHDITSGANNTYSAVAGNGKTAVSGYDLVTGLGSPVVNTLIPYLANKPPTVASAPTAAVAAILSDGRGEEISLSALGAQGGVKDDSSLTYQWTVSGPNGVTAAGVMFENTASVNANKNDSAIITQAGTYIFSVTITNSYGLNVVSSAPSLVITPAPQTVTVSPSRTGVLDGQNEQFAVSAKDQFGNPYSPSASDTITWSAKDGVITQGGEYTAPATGAGTDTVSVQLSDGPSAIPVEGSASVSFAAALGVGAIFTANLYDVGSYTASGATVAMSLPEGLNGPSAFAFSGNDIFVANSNSGTIGEYTTAGAIVNAALITGLNSPSAIAVSGSDLFVINGSGTIGEYTTSGATVNASLITDANGPSGIAASGSDLFIANESSSTIDEYTLAGALVKTSLISGAGDPVAIAISGSDLFVTNTVAGAIDEYTTDGATVKTGLVSGLLEPGDVAVSGSDVFVQSEVNEDDFGIGEYAISNGAIVSAALIDGFGEVPHPFGISGADIFASDPNENSVDEYTTSGAVVTIPLIAGLVNPATVAVSGSDLFVGDTGNGTVNEYTTAGVPLRTPLVTVGSASNLAVSGSDLYVVDSSEDSVNEYTTDGTLVQLGLINGLNSPRGIAVSNGYVYVSENVPEDVREFNASTGALFHVFSAGLDFPAGISVFNSQLFVVGGDGSIVEYNANTGALINTALITGLNAPSAIVATGPDLFIAGGNGDSGTGQVGEYTVGGATVNAALITGDGVIAANDLALISPPVVVTDPESDTVSAGTDASFTALASGAPEPTVQWMVARAGSSTFTPIVGATALTLDLGAVAVTQSGNKYEAVFSNGEGLPATTSPATLTVTDPDQLSPTANNDVYSTPVSTTLTVSPDGIIGNDYGTNVVPILVSGPSDGTATIDQFGNTVYTPNTAFVGTDSFTYEDADFSQIGPGQAAFNAIESASSAPFTQADLASYPSGDYTLSNVATFTVSVNNAAPVVDGQGGETITEAVGTETLLTAQATGTPYPTVQWYELNENLDQSTFAPIPGATATMPITGGSTAQLDLGSATTDLNGTYYLAVFTNSQGSSSSIVIELNILSAADDGYSTTPNQSLTVPAAGVLNNDIGLNESAALVGDLPPDDEGSLDFNSDGSFTYTPGDYTGTYTFTYQQTFTVVITPDEVKPPGNKAIAQVAKFTPFFVGSDDEQVLGNVATVTIFSGTPAAVTLNPKDQTFAVGTDATFTAAASGTPTPTVQWYVEDSGTTEFTPIAGATSTTLDLGPAMADENGNKYEAVFTGPLGPVTTTAATLTVSGGVSAAGQLTGTPSANTSSSYNNLGNTYLNVFDGNTNTYFDAPSADGNYVQLDLGSARTITEIAYAPRAGFEGRMIGGVFEASNSSTFASGVVTLFPALTTAPPDGLTTVAVSPDAAYEFVRYVAPAGSYGNIAELQVFGPGGATPPASTSTELTGTYSASTTDSYDHKTSDNYMAVFDNNTNTYWDSPNPSGNWVQIDLGASPSSLTQLDFAPRPGFESRMIGGVFEASNSSSFSTFTTLYTVSQTPQDGLTTVPISGTFEFIRYVAPANSYGNIAEMELYGPGETTAPAPAPPPPATVVELSGTASGTAGSYDSKTSDNYTAAFDGSLSTFFDAPTAGTSANPNYVEFTLPEAESITQLKFAPRVGFEYRMMGGVFQVSTSSTFASGSTVTVDTLTQAPSDGLTTIPVSGSYQYIRYIAPANAYGNIAELQVYGIPGTAAPTTPPSTPTSSQLTNGTESGTAGSYQSDGDTFANAFDGSTNTFFDAPSAGTTNSPNYVQLSFSAPKTITSLAFAPRAGYEYRMAGGYFEASNDANFGANDTTTLYTISGTPSPGLTTITFPFPGSYQYVRYIAPAGSYGNIAEMQLFGY